MAVVAVPEKAAEHLQAAIFFSQREVCLRLLGEAEVLVQLEELKAAALTAGPFLKKRHGWDSPAWFANKLTPGVNYETEQRALGLPKPRQCALSTTGANFEQTIK